MAEPPNASAKFIFRSANESYLPGRVHSEQKTYTVAAFHAAWIRPVVTTPRRI